MPKNCQIFFFLTLRSDAVCRSMPAVAGHAGHEVPCSQGSMLIPRADGGGRRRPVSRALAITLAAAGCAALAAVVLVAQARSSSAVGDKELIGRPVGRIINTLSHKLAVHANVGDFVISGDLKTTTLAG